MLHLASPFCFANGTVGAQEERAAAECSFINTIGKSQNSTPLIGLLPTSCYSFCLFDEGQYNSTHINKYGDSERVVKSAPLKEVKYSIIYSMGAILIDHVEKPFVARNVI